MKTCFKCNQRKELNDFYTHKQMSDGHLNKCKECTKKDVSDRLIKEKEKIREYDLKRYRTNHERLKKHKYLGIKTRCEGRHRNRKYIVQGMPYLSWEEYEEWWSENESVYLKCHEAWEKSGYKNRLAPSIDRINSKKGYVPENMQWLPLTLNCSKHTK